MDILGLLSSGLFIISGQFQILNSVFNTKQIHSDFNRLNASNIERFDLGQELAFEGTGRPPNRSSGGGRGPCEDSLITLVPGIGLLSSDGETCNGVSSSINTFTHQEKPTLWLYVSGDYPSGTTLTVQLIEDRTVVAAQDFTLPVDNGVMSVQLDQTLNVGTTYTWTAEIKIFSGRGRSDNPTAGGIITRRTYPNDFSTEIEALSPTDKSRYFLAYGLWYDALNEIAAARFLNSEDENLAQEWESLLTVFGLGVISDQPLINCCKKSD